MNGFTTWLAEIVADAGTAGVAWAADATLAAAAISLVVLLLNGLARRWFSADQMSWLWALVLLRLALPYAPPSPWSMQMLWFMVGSENYGVSAAPAGDVRILPPATARADGPVFRTRFRASQSPPAHPARPFWRALTGGLPLLPAIWWTGLALSLTSAAIRHVRFLVRLRQGRPCFDPRLVGLWNGACRSADVRTGIPIVMWDGISHAAVAGVWRPRLLLAPHMADLTDQQLHMVLLHEAAHIRRQDVAIQALLSLVQAVHWWNPVFWLAAARFQSLREQACDALALQRLPGHPERAYGELLLELAVRPTRSGGWQVALPVSLAGFLSTMVRTRAVRNRLRALPVALVARSRWQPVGASACLACLALCGLTSATPPITSSPRVARALIVGEPYGSGGVLSDTAVSAPIWNEPLEMRSYDLDPAIARVATQVENPSEAQTEVHTVLSMIVRGSTGRFDAVTTEWLTDHLQFDGPVAKLNAPAIVHQRIERVLDAWAESGLVQTSIRVRLISDERDLAEHIGFVWQQLSAEDLGVPQPTDLQSEPGPVVRARATVEEVLPVAIATLTSGQVDTLMRDVQTSSRGIAVQLPTVTLFNGQDGTIQDCWRRPFVTGIDVAESGLSQSQISVIEEGTKLIVRATRLPGSDDTRLGAQVELSQIEEVRNLATKVRGKPQVLQVPRVRRSRIDVAADLLHGQSLLIGCLPASGQNTYSYVLVTALALEP
ncbi:MAG: M56 family metallopeptidase [Pirellulaceae bacterium]